MLCLGKLKCDRVVYNRLSRSCKLYNLPNKPAEEELISSRWDTYAVMKRGCAADAGKQPGIEKSAFLVLSLFSTVCHQSESSLSERILYRRNLHTVLPTKDCK